MFKLPFYNRKNYTLLRFVGNSQYAHDFAPPTLTGRAKHCTFADKSSSKSDNLQKDLQGTFRTCYGLVSSYNKSITIPNWADIVISVDDKKLDVLSSAKIGQSWNVTDHTEDPDYNMPKGMAILKFVNPWRVEMETSETNPEFVCASHLLNTTPMMIPTGVVTFKYQPDLNIFNKVNCNYNQQYKIPFKHPLIQVFPLSSSKLYIETEYDPDKYQKLSHLNTGIPYYRGSHIKLLKPNKKT